MITDSDLARAREDPDFRQQLVTESLERLLGELSKLQRAAHGVAQADQVREGAELAGQACPTFCADCAERPARAA